MKQLFIAIKSGDLNALKAGFSEIQDINAWGEGGETLLTHAAKHGNMAIVDFLIERGALASVANKRGQLPSNIAMASGKGAIFARIKSAQGKDVKQNARKEEEALSAEEIDLLKQVNDIDWNPANKIFELMGNLGAKNMAGIKERLANGTFAKTVISLQKRDHMLSTGAPWNRSLKGYFESRYTQLQVLHDLANGMAIDLKNEMRYPSIDEYTLSWIAQRLLSNSHQIKIADDMLVAQHLTLVIHLLESPAKYAIAALPNLEEEMVDAFANATLYRNNDSITPEHIKLFHAAGVYRELERNGKFPATLVATSEDPAIKAVIKDVFDPDLAFKSMSWASDWSHPWVSKDQHCVFDRLISMGASMPSPELITDSLKHLLTKAKDFQLDEMERLMDWLIEHGADKNLKMDHKDSWNISATDFVLRHANLDRQIHPAHILQLKVLIKHGFEVDWTRVIEMVKKADTKSLVELLMFAPDGIDARNSSGETALMIAAKEFAVDEVTVLLVFGANPHLDNSQGKNALALVAKRAARTDQTKQAKEAVALLLANEMSPEEADPAHIAKMTRLRSLATIKEGDKVFLSYPNGDQLEAVVEGVGNLTANLDIGMRFSLRYPINESRFGPFEVLKEGEEPLIINKKSSSLRM